MDKKFIKTILQGGAALAIFYQTTSTDFSYSVGFQFIQSSASCHSYASYHKNTELLFFLSEKEKQHPYQFSEGCSSGFNYYFLPDTDRKSVRCHGRFF